MSTNENVRIAVIGTAGRKDDGPKMTRSLYQRMYQHLCMLLSNVSGRQITLVSGGAAWADHLAVSAFLDDKCQALELHLPAPFTDSRFFEEGRMSPGSISNYYHGCFGRAMCGDPNATLRGIERAILKGAKVIEGDGFFGRNIQVGKVDFILAYTWGEGSVPKDGGTLHTWNNSHAPKKFHFPLKGL